MTVQARIRAVAMKGVRSGVHEEFRWTVDDGFLILSMPEWRARALTDAICVRIKQLARNELHAAEDMFIVHRLSRMAYELISRSGISTMDKKDVACIYELLTEEATGGLLKVLNETRSLIRVTDVDPAVADGAAKAVSAVLSD